MQYLNLISHISGMVCHCSHMRLCFIFINIITLYRTVYIGLPYRSTVTVRIYVGLCALLIVYGYPIIGRRVGPTVIGPKICIIFWPIYSFILGPTIRTIHACRPVPEHCVAHTPSGLAGWVGPICRQLRPVCGRRLLDIADQPVGRLL